MTLSELARAVNQADDAQDLLHRRIRHWSLAGVLPTAGEAHTGTGRMRRYDPRMAYVLALLNALADFGLGVGALKAVSSLVRTILTESQEARKLWVEAMGGAANSYLWLLPKDDGEGGGKVEVNIVPKEAMCDLAAKRGGIVLNLRRVFQSVNV